MFLSNLGLEEKGIDLKEQLRIGIFALPIYIFCFSVIDLELVTNNLLDHSLLYIFTLSNTVLEHGQTNYITQLYIFSLIIDYCHSWI